MSKTMNHSELENVIGIVKESYKEFGLQDFDVCLLSNLAGMSRDIGISQTIKLPYRTDNRKEILEVFSSVITNIQNSKYVKDKEKRHSEEVEKLNDRIKELEKYETYYKLAKELGN